MKFTKLIKQIKSADQPTTPKPTAQLPQNMEYAWDPKANQWIAVMKDNTSVTPPLYNPQNQNTMSNATTYMSNVKSASVDDTLVLYLSEFLNEPRYSREIKIKADLIKDGLLEYAGFDPFKGVKYSISKKGLEYLKQAAQKEYDLEKEDLDTKKSYLLDGISESELQTGDAVYKGLMPKKYSIFEINGEELGKIEASNETDVKVKFILQHPEYEDSQTICVKEINSNYSETTNEALTYPNPGISPSTDIELENHNGWVNTAEQNVTQEFAKLHSILGEYKKQDKIHSIFQDGNDLLVTCSPITSLELKEKIEELGYKCEEIDESETGDEFTIPMYTLRIKLK